jgi:hypothetical protein
MDRERLMALLSPEGALGRTLGQGPPIAALVPGPDYLRVVLETTPYLSFVLTRADGQVRIRSWATTWCGDCREPTRAVVDLIARAGLGEGPQLVPGLDLVVPGEVTAADEPGGSAWRAAFVARNHAAGFLRWLLADADVLGQDVDGVQVAFRDRVETWPIDYAGGAWVLDYERLPTDSPLRLEQDDVRGWHDEERVRAAALDWWLPERARMDHGGRLVASMAVAVARQTPTQRWLVAVERPDGLAAGLFGFDGDGTVGLRVPLPPWPDQVARPVRSWAEAWTSAVSPAADRLLLAGAGRWWLVDLASGEARQGRAGVLDGIRAAAWSLDGSTIAVGDESGSLALLTPGDPQPTALRVALWSGAGDRVAVAGLAFAPGAARLLVAGIDGRVQAFTLPGLEPAEDLGETCCGYAVALLLDAARDRVLVACGGGCPAQSVVALPLHSVGDPLPHPAAPAAAGGVLSLSPDGRWLVLAGGGPDGEPDGAAVLCHAPGVVPAAAFSDVPLVDVAWDEAGTAFLALREDGSAVLWTVADVLGGEAR